MTATDDLILLLGSEGELPLADLLAKVPEPALAAAWAKGDVEFGKTKYVLTGNAETAVTVHNGVRLPEPAVVIEGGVEWGGPKQRWHQSLAKLKQEKLPASARYQKYQLEVCVNKEKDAWDWLPEGETPDGRETRYARRDVKRADAEKCFALYVRLTDKGAAALSN